MSIVRNICADVKVVMQQYPIIAITGPRQSGKTTVLRDLLPDYRYVTLENPDVRAYAVQDGKGFFAEYDDKVILDEVQRVPAVFSYLQGIVDQNKVMGQYMLSGSQNFELMENISQSLAGRVALYNLYPFDTQELVNTKHAPSDLGVWLSTGGYPAIYDRGIKPSRYFADYMQTYIKRDIARLVNVRDMAKFERFIRLCATRAGQLVNYNDLGRDAGISHTNVNNWLSLLETSYVLYRLPPYHKNYSKRLIKSPKLYFYDTGLLAYLLGIKSDSLSPQHSHYGALFENMVVSEYIKQASHQGIDRDYYFWRDSQGREVDLLYSEDQQLHIVEIKSTATIMPRLFKGLDFFQKLAADEVATKTLVYGGDKDQRRIHYRVKSWRSALV